MNVARQLLRETKKSVVDVALDVGYTNPGRTRCGAHSSGAEELARMIPNAWVVFAFNTVPSEVLFGVYEAKSKSRRPSLLYCGNDERGKGVAVELIRDVGFDPVDVGPLRIARYTEPFALLVAELAYEREGRPELAYRFEWFRK